MTDIDALPLFDEPAGPRAGAAPARKCRHPSVSRVFEMAKEQPASGPTAGRHVCGRCGKEIDPFGSRRSRNNRKRGGAEELAVAQMLGGQKVGQLNLPHDVEVPGYLRVQCKKLGHWPSLAQVVTWLDAMGTGPEMRAVTVADTPGGGSRKVRRLLIVDAEDFARWHGKGTAE